MKIAIPVSGKDSNPLMDSRLGRCEYFWTFDDQTREVSRISNAQNLQSPQGAGIQAAQNLLNASVEVLICANCGPKAFKVLEASGVAVYLAAEENAESLIEKFQKDSFEKMKSANVQGHW
jgi:predicted Fe-Mo cluster-binding NifX family protein